MQIYNENAERAVLYIMLNNAEKCARGVITLSDMDFFRPLNMSVFRSICRLTSECKPVDAATLVPVVEDWDYVLGLHVGYYPESNFDAYIQELKETRCRRELCSGLHTVIQMAENNEPGYLQKAQQTISDSLSLGGTGITPVGNVVFDAIDTIGKQDTCLSSGFREFDNLTKGLRVGELIVIGARPSMGKTSFAMNIALNIASQGMPVAVFSLETFQRDLMKRATFAAASVSEDDYLFELKKKVDNGAIANTFIAAEQLSKLPLFIDDRRNVTIGQIAAQCFDIKNQAKGLSFVVIDYLGLIKTVNRKDMTREREIAEITRSLKILAGDLKCPILLLSQLNRESEKRPYSEPRLADLRESGSIEQDADIVVFINRDKDISEEADIIVAKNRNGRVGKIRMKWAGKYFRFEDYIA